MEQQSNNAEESWPRTGDGKRVYIRNLCVLFLFWQMLTDPSGGTGLPGHLVVWNVEWRLSIWSHMPSTIRLRNGLIPQVSSCAIAITKCEY